MKLLGLKLVKKQTALVKTNNLTGPVFPVMVQWMVVLYLGQFSGATLRLLLVCKGKVGQITEMLAAAMPRHVQRFVPNPSVKHAI